MGGGGINRVNIITSVEGGGGINRVNIITSVEGGGLRIHSSRNVHIHKTLPTIVAN